MSHRKTVTKQKIFTQKQIDTIYALAKKAGVDIESMDYRDYVDYCENTLRKHLNKEHSADPGFDLFFKTSRWRLDEPQEPKPL